MNTSSRFHGLAARLLAALLALCILPPLSALAQGGEMERGNLFGSSLHDVRDNIHSVALVGDTLYIRTYKSLYTFAPGDQKAVKRAEMNAPGYGNYAAGVEEEEEGPRISAIFAHGDRLLGLDQKAQSLYTIRLDQDQVAFTAPLKLDLSAFIEGEPPYVYMKETSWMKVIGGKLFMRFQNHEDLPVDLYSFDLITGEKKEYSVTHLQSAAAYRDGSLIAIKADPNKRYDEKTEKILPPQLVQFDPESDSETLLAELHDLTMEEHGNYPDLWYDAATGSLYSYTDTDVFRFDGDYSKGTLIGYLPMIHSFWGTLPGALNPLPGDRLAIAFNDNVFIRPRTEKGREGITVLSMSGNPDDDGSLSSVLMELDDIVLRRVEGIPSSYVNAEQLASMFLTGSVNVDIMNLNVNSFDLDKLIAKGYLSSLSESPVIQSHLEGIAPNLRKSFLVDGQAYAVPSSIVVFPIGVKIKSFEELGLAVPASITGIVDLAEQWMAGLHKEHPDFLLFSDGYNYKRSLQDLVIDKYISNTLGAGRELVFDTPLFRTLMQRIEQIDWQEYDKDPDWGSDNARSMMEEFFKKKPLLETRAGYEPRYFSMRHMEDIGASEALVLPLEDGQEGFQEADFGLLVVLSTSKNKEAALRFIESYIDNQNPVDKAALNLEAKEPIPNPEYEISLRDYETTINQMEAQLKKAEGAEKSNLEEALASIKKYYEQQKESGKYLATGEDLAMIHRVINRLFVFSGLGNAQHQAFGNDYDLRVQYYEGVITLDQFIQQVDDKLRLVRMEYN